MRLHYVVFFAALLIHVPTVLEVISIA